MRQADERIRPSTERLAYRPVEAAAVIGISSSLLYRLIADGRLSTVKVDGVRVVPASALRKLIEGVEG